MSNMQQCSEVLTMSDSDSQWMCISEASWGWTLKLSSFWGWVGWFWQPSRSCITDFGPLLDLGVWAVDLPMTWLGAASTDMVKAAGGPSAPTTVKSAADGVSRGVWSWAVK